MMPKQKQQNKEQPASEPEEERYHSLDLQKPTPQKKKKRCCSNLRDWYDEEMKKDELDQNIIVLLIDFNRKRSWKKKIFSVIVFCISIAVIVDLIFFGYITPKVVLFLKWASQNSIEALFAFIGFFAAATLIFIPPFFLTFGAGYMYQHIYGPAHGIAVATGACFVGSYIGAILSFVRAKYMMRDLVKLFSRRYTLVRACDKALRKKGFRVMLLLRLCPIIPFNAINYIGGVTGVKWNVFSLAHIGILPMQTLTIAMGASAGSFSDADNAGNYEQRKLQDILVIAGLGFGVVALFLTFNFARDELKREIKEAQTTDVLMARAIEYQAYEEHKAALKMIHNPGHDNYLRTPSTVDEKKKYIGKLQDLSVKEPERQQTRETERSNSQSRIAQSMSNNSNQTGDSDPLEMNPSDTQQSEEVTSADYSDPLEMNPSDTQQSEEVTSTDYLQVNPIIGFDENESVQSKKNSLEDSNSTFDTNQLERYYEDGIPRDDEEWFWFWV